MWRARRRSTATGTTVSLAAACAIIAGCGSARPPGATSPASAAPPSAQLLAVFPGPSFRYELSYERPARPRQPRAIRVTLRTDAATLDSVVIDHDEGRDYAPNAPDVDFGVAPDTAVWTGETSIAVGARVVNLAPGEIGLLVTERIGQEHVSRRHRLYLARNGRLATIWSWEQEVGDQWEARVVSPIGARYQDVAILSVVQPEEGGEVAGVRAYRLHWEPALLRIVKSPLPAAELPLTLLYLGPYRSRDAALAARVQNDACDFRRALLPGAAFPGLHLEGVISGRIFLDRDEAASARKQLVRCPASAAPKSVEYVPVPTGAFERREGGG